MEKENALAKEQKEYKSRRGPVVEVSFGELCAIQRHTQKIIAKISDVENDDAYTDAIAMLIEMYKFAETLKDPRRHYRLHQNADNCKLDQETLKNNCHS